MTITENLNIAIVHDCPCMKEVVNMSSVKVGVALAGGAVAGYVCGIGIKRIFKDVRQVILLKNTKSK